MTCSLGHDPEPLYVGVDDHQPHEEHREVEEGVGPGADQANQEGSKMAKNGLNGLYSINFFFRDHIRITQFYHRFFLFLFGGQTWLCYRCFDAVCLISFF